MNAHRLLVHPVRARILAALAGRRLTREEIGRLIPETPLPSIYRNLRLLVEGGAVEVVERIPRRGVEEHVYGLVEGKTSVTEDEARTWGPAEWQRALDLFLQGLLMGYRTYLAAGGDRPSPANARAMWLTEEEKHRMGEELESVFARYRDLSEEGRDRTVVALVVQPAGSAAVTAASGPRASRPENLV